MKDSMKGLYLALLASIVVIFIINLIFPQKPITRPVREAKAPQVEQVKKVLPEQNAVAVAVETALKADKRVFINNGNVNGTIRVRGARFDNLNLSKYKENLEKDSPDVELLTPGKTKLPYYAEFGFLAQDTNIKLPNADTLWKVKGSKLTAETPLFLEWNNEQGLKFVRKISLDKHYMFTIEDSIENNGSQNINLYPYGLISKTIEQTGNSVVHEGFVGVVDNNLKEIKYASLKKDEQKTFETTGGWAGFSDRYWFTSFILDKQNQSKVKIFQPQEHLFQADFVGSAINIPAGTVGVSKVRFFAGAKEIKLLDKYAENENIAKFDLAIDFGWYYFLTKPFFYILDFLYKLIGNMGWAILLFAALLRLAMFPVANKSFESMSRMKKVQPRIKDLQERYKDDKIALQKEMMELYKREKINPASGCLPMFIQIPVFFSLYKVLNIAIEIRQAPFIGWIKDLSQPDPLTLSVITHLPVPGLLNIGIWPILMGITMWVQQKLNPAPTNKDQARMFAFLPLIFTFMLGHFASGLVIYWTLSNLLSILQQKAIMKKNGVN